MIVEEHATGLRLATVARSLVVVDTRRGVLELAVGRGLRREYAASREGLRAAVHVLQRYAQAARKHEDGPSMQGDLFQLGSPRVRETIETPELETLLVEALRRSARARCATLDEADAVVAAVRPTPLLCSAPVLALPYFAADVVRFRAAAVAAAMLETLPQATETTTCAHPIFKQLGDWRRLFSRSGVVSRALNKTLADLSQDADAADVWALRNIQLERPVQSRLHLHLLAERARGRGEFRDEQLALLQHADEDELVELRERTARALGVGHLSDAAKDHVFVETVARGGAPRGRDTVRTLVRRALLLPRRRPSEAPSLAKDTPTRAPPIPAPSGVRFLCTIGEVVAEGMQMEHCVGSYAREATEGVSFLFHVVVDGEHATVEVDCRGAVVDAAGPRNQCNVAAEHGRQLLAAWGAGFWAARIGELSWSTWVEPAPDIPRGVTALATLGACLIEFHRRAAETRRSLDELVEWFEAHAARAVKGREWLVADRRQVLALDDKGVIVSVLSKRGVHDTVVEDGCETT
ncbi:MAG: PcfJ domain-containing protein [Deltaproteobacteria bacterium]|nr:PcfJ domain-containing protein [Deltaproteobacteria bacterium]